jgi:hypothetical protein
MCVDDDDDDDDDNDEPFRSTLQLFRALRFIISRIQRR